LSLPGANSSGETMPSNSNPLLAKEIEANGQFLVITTRRGRYEIPWGICGERLERATAVERAQVKLSPSGFGIHWPLLDEDLTVEGLVLQVDPKAV
jgi:Protein of unknown function (DUF2442)